VHVNEGGPAERAGWGEGERIVAIDGEPIGDDYWEKHYGWGMRPAGTKVTLETSDGRSRTLVLRDYY